MKFSRFVGSFALSLIVSSFILQSNVYAFAVKSHVHIANEALAAARELERNHNIPMAPHVSEALEKFPASFRAGSLGPDVFPDFVAGQVWVHANHGREAGLAGDIPLEQRKSVSEWRSIDYGMYMLKRAHEYHDEVRNDDGLKAIAFAYGYLSHMVGDGFAHSFVNEWSGGAFALTEGTMEDYPVLEEIRHWAIESLLDDTLPIDSEQMEIDAPSDFLFRIMTEEVVIQDAQGNDIVVGPPGAFGGEYYVALVELRDKFRRWSSSENWVEGDLLNWLVEAQDIMSKISTAGTDIGNPITDLEYLMAKRAELFDSILLEWMWLSECSGQNILLNEVNGISPTDACLDVNFEPEGSGLGSLYGGKLNEAAHKLNGDPRDLNANVERMIRFAEAATKEILAFDMIRDVGSHEKLKNIESMCVDVVEWGGCENACESAKSVCSDTIGGAICYSNFCPQRNNHFSCEGWGRGIYCFLNPVCQACAGKVVDALTGGFCAVAVDAGSAGACTLCDQHPICDMMDSVEGMRELISEKQKSILWDLYESDVKEYVQKHVSPKMLEQLQRLEELVAMQSLARKPREAKSPRFWMLNQTYFSEDIIAGGRQWLNIIFNGAMGISIANLEQVKTREEFADLTWSSMSSRERNLWAGGPLSARAAYEEFIDNLWSLQLSSSWARAVFPVKPTFWFDLSVLRDVPENQRGSRYAELLDEMALIVEQPGPTASYFLTKMTGKSVITLENAFVVEADLFKFEPSYNAITLTRNSLFPAYNIAMPSHNTSDICGKQPHVLCDGIASLDDPNNLGPQYVKPRWMPRRPDISGLITNPGARDYSFGWNNSENRFFPSDPQVTLISNFPNPARGDNLRPSDDLERVFEGQPELARPIYILPENIDLERQPFDRDSILGRYPQTREVDFEDLLGAWLTGDEATIASIIEPEFPDELPQASTLTHSTERSVYAWYSVPIVWEPGYLGPSRQWDCRYGTTEFSLAHSEAYLDRNYLPVYVPHYEECVVKPKILRIDREIDLDGWSASEAVMNFNPDRMTGGRGSLDVCLRGSTTLRSPPFRTTEFGQVGDRFSFDVFAPRQLDSASYAEVFMELAGSGTQSLGRVNLNGSAVDRWNRLELPIESGLLAELQNPNLSDNRVLIEFGGFDAERDTCIGLDSIAYTEGALKPQNAANVVTRGVPVPDTGYGPGLLSFENLADWRSEQTGIRQDFTRFTDGRASLAITPNNFTYIRSRLFRPSELGARGSQIKLDMLIPLQQPNAHWIGQAQLFLSCPSVGVNDAFLGFQDLTNLPRNQFVPLTFNLTSVELAALNSNSNDCSFAFALNANVGAGEFLIDKMRFAN